MKLAVGAAAMLPAASSVTMPAPFIGLPPAVIFSIKRLLAVFSDTTPSAAVATIALAPEAAPSSETATGVFTSGLAAFGTATPPTEPSAESEIALAVTTAP